MQDIIATILPVFGLIALGFAAARAGYIPAAAAQGLAQFVFNLAMPALLFRTVATVSSSPASPWNLWGALFGGLAIAWGLTMLLGRRLEVRGEGTASLAMAATFGNVAMLGLPLSVAQFGQEAALPVSLILAIHAPVLWLAAILHIETERHGRLPSLTHILRQLIRELLRNPIVLSLALGALWHVSGLTLPAIPDRMLELLGSAGIPSALVALGLALASYSLRGRSSEIALIIAMKMLVIPIAVFVLVTYVFPLPTLWKQVVLLISVMPTGANAYLFAQRYEQHPAAVSGSIAIGTALAVLSTGVLLWLMELGAI
jgi:malonate transporter and related proteins